MKFVKTVNWTILNWEEIKSIEYRDNNNRYYCLFILKSGEEFDAFDAPSYFSLEDEDTLYNFCFECAAKYNEILVCKICKFFSDDDNHLFNCDDYDKFLWCQFIEWAKDNKSELERHKP